MTGVSIRNLTRYTSSVTSLPFAKVAKDILSGWDISLVFVGATMARILNKKTRGKTYTPNVLSYIVGDKSAEIIICPIEAIKQASAFQLPASNFLLLLFIHGVLHIKGWVHGAKMDKCERNLLKRYETAHRHRHRHRHVSGEDGRRRGALR